MYSVRERCLGSGATEILHEILRSVRYLTPRLDAMINEVNIGCYHLTLTLWSWWILRNWCNVTYYHTCHGLIIINLLWFRRGHGGVPSQLGAAGEAVHGVGVQCARPAAAVPHRHQPQAPSTQQQVSNSSCLSRCLLGLDCIVQSSKIGAIAFLFGMVWNKFNAIVKLRNELCHWLLGVNRLCCLLCVTLVP